MAYGDSDENLGLLNLTAYGDRLSVRPQETIKVFVNCEGAEHFKAESLRLICGDENPCGPGFKAEPVDMGLPGSFPGRHQKIHAGSYIVIEPRQILEQMTGLTVQAFIFPTTPERGKQGIITKWCSSEQTGFALFIDEKSCTAFKIGDGSGTTHEVSVDTPLSTHDWYFVAGTYNSKSGSLEVCQEPVRNRDLSRGVGSAQTTGVADPISSNGVPLMMAAFCASNSRGDIVGDSHFNGKIDAPRLSRDVLTLDEMKTLQSSPLTGVVRNKAIGIWDFSQKIDTDEIVDVSEHRLHGRTVNLPARAVTGQNWSGKEFCWRHAPETYGAIHFHEDDLYDANWECDFELTVPEDTKSGLHCVRLSAGTSEEFVPFVVRPTNGNEAEIAFILPSATHMAYGNEHMSTDAWDTELLRYHAVELHPYQLFLNEHREYGLCFYDLHLDGSPVYYSSRLRPVLNMRPKAQSILGGRGSSLWGFNADTHIVDWLEESGLRYDVLTDEDVHYEGLDVLRRYGVVITGTHPEYVSSDIWNSLYDYLSTGGRIMNLGGNTFYLRIAYDQTMPGVIECRWDVGAGQAGNGEHNFSFVGERSGIWRGLGQYAPQVMTGVGFASQGFDISSHYRRTPESDDPRVRFIFEGIDADEIIGDFGLIGGGAAGLELDICDPDLGTPHHALRVASSENHTDTYQIAADELDFNYPGTGGQENSLVRGDMVFFETPKSGAVFSTGSIAWAGSLSHNSYDNNVSRLTGNVLKRFLDPEAFPFE